MIKTKGVALFIFTMALEICLGQSNIIISGKVLNGKTRLPMANATVGMLSHPYGTYTDMEGRFKLLIPENAYNDSLIISYVGYKVIKHRLPGSELKDTLYLLEENATVLDEVTILAQSPDKFEIRKMEAALRNIKGNVYAFDTELTNKEYNKFLTYLLQSGQNKLYEKYKPDFSKYHETELTFFKAYHTIVNSKEKKYIMGYDDYPIVNITHEAAIAYCEWLTDQYNSSGKKKFRQATFRLPTAREWQIAALGYPRFQSWILEENTIEVTFPDDKNEMMGKKKKVIPVKDNDILYPWFAAYYYRNKAQNNRNCWLGNFNIPKDATACDTYRTSGDGFSMIGKCRSYFPNDLGLFDVVGNVAEMIDEEGKAYGGSWNHPPEESTIVSVMNYTGTKGTVGFRVFMEVMGN